MQSSSLSASLHLEPGPQEAANFERPIAQNDDQRYTWAIRTRQGKNGARVLCHRMRQHADSRR
jgi:hypothetical protein